MAPGCATLHCGLYWLWRMGSGSAWDGFVLGRVRSLWQFLIGALGGGVVTSGLMTGWSGTGPFILKFGAYVFVMDLGFGNTALCPPVFFAAGRR